MPLGPLSASVRGANTCDRLSHMYLYYWTIPINARAYVVVAGRPRSMIPCTLFGSVLIPSLVIK